MDTKTRRVRQGVARSDRPRGRMPDRIPGGGRSEPGRETRDRREASDDRGKYSGEQVGMYNFGDMKTPLLIVATAFLVTVMACGSRPATETAKTAPTATAAPAPTAYRAPEIGMDYLDFHKLCGDPDHINTQDSATGHITVERYSYSDVRAKSSCWGTFAFADYRLQSITR